MPVTKRSSGATDDDGIDDEQQRIGDRAGAARQREQPPRIDAVGQAEQRADEAAGHEAGLHAAGERRLREADKVEFATSDGSDGRRGEPQRHRRDLADRDER